MTNTSAHVYLADANFNVTAMLDATTATSPSVVERYSYTPYGEVSVLNADFSYDGSSDIGNTYMYTGRWRDPDTNLQLNRNRWFSSGLGRWLTRDPIGYDGGAANLYEYVGSNPILHFDPLGLRIVEKKFGISKLGIPIIEIVLTYDVQKCSVAFLGAELEGITFWGIGTYEVKASPTDISRECDPDCDCPTTRNGVRVHVKIVKTIGYKGVGYTWAPEKLKFTDEEWADECCCEE